MTVARLGYEIDSSGAVVAAGNLDKMSAAAKVAETQQVSLKGAMGELNRLTGKASAEFIRLKASEDSAFAAAVKLKQAQDLLNAELKAGNITAAQHAASMGNLTTRYQSQIAVVGNFSTAMKGSAAQTANLGAQLNDIGVMLAAGQNPLQLAVQQGTQINQVFAQMGGGKAALRGLAAGFMSMVNPMSLATIGIIAGGAALVQWAVAAAGAGRDADNLEAHLDALADIMDLVEQSTDVINTSTDELIQKYGMAANRVREFALAQAELAQSQAERRLRDQVGLLDVVVDRYGAVGEAVEIAGYRMENDLQLANIQRDLKVSADQAFILMDAFTALGDASTFKDQQDALSGILATMEDQGVALSLLPPELQEAISEMITLSNEADAAKAAMDRLAGAAANVTVGVPLFLQGFSGRGLLPPETPERPGRGGGGRSRVDEFARDLEALRESLRTEQEVINEWKMEQDALLANERAVELLGIDGHNQAKLRLEQEYQERLAEIKDAERGGNLATLSEFFGDAAGLMQSGNAKLFKIGKAAAIANAIVNGQSAAVAAWDKGMQAGGPPLAAAFAGLSVAKTASQIAALKSASFGGGGSGSGSSAGITAASSTPQPQQTRAIISVQSGRSRFTVEEIDDIVRQLQGQSDDGVIIEGITRG